jgi:hypothetical protein
MAAETTEPPPNTLLHLTRPSVASPSPPATTPAPPTAPLMV